MKRTLTRRGFIRKTAAGSAALTCLSSSAPSAFAAEAAKPALLGGAPVPLAGVLAKARAEAAAKPTR